MKCSERGFFVLNGNFKVENSVMESIFTLPSIDNRRVKWQASPLISYLHSINLKFFCPYWLSVRTKQTLFGFSFTVYKTMNILYGNQKNVLNGAFLFWKNRNFENAGINKFRSRLLSSHLHGKFFRLEFYAHPPWCAMRSPV